MNILKNNCLEQQFQEQQWKIPHPVFKKNCRILKRDIKGREQF